MFAHEIGQVTSFNLTAFLTMAGKHKPDPEVEEAIRRVRCGESSAYETVVRRFERPLRSWLATQAPPAVDIDDVAQRSFVIAFTRLDDYEQGTNFGAWLFTIARYQLRTETTRLRRVADYHTRYAPELLARELDRRADDPPEFQLARLEHLRVCLGQLGEHLRRFITWRYDEGIPLEEMEEKMGLTND